MEDLSEEGRENGLPVIRPRTLTVTLESGLEI